MNEIVKIDSGNILAIIHGPSGLPDFAKPFARQIYLLDVHIAGTSHIENIKEIEPALKTGMKLKFFRDVKNKFDANAILVEDDSQNKLGFIPQDKNEILSRLMDAGKLLYGTVKSKEFVNDWLKITIQVYLDD